MDLLNQDIREATKAKFEAELLHPVKILYFTQEPSRLVLLGPLQGRECEFCGEARRLLEEVKALSEKIELRVFDFKAEAEAVAKYGIDKIPAAVIMGEEDYGIRIYGIPSGYEYQTLIEDIVDVSRRESGLAEKTREAVRTIDRDVRIQVFVTPTCPYCGLAVRLAHQFAIESPFIRGEMVESTEFPQLSDRYNVYGVPKIVINDVVSFEGAVPEEEFLAQVLAAVQQASPSK